MKLARKWILVATLLLSMAVATTGTLAYLTDTDTRTNVFTMGKVDISIVETDVDNKLTPGATANKDAEIKNDGDTDAYVWMTVVLDENLDKLVELTWKDYTPKTLTSEDPGYEAGKTTYLVKYPEVLAVGASTGKILDAVTMKGNVDVQDNKLVLIEDGVTTATYEGARDNLQITVNAYAVQADGMNGVDDAYNKYYAQWGANGGGTSGEGDAGSQPTTNVTTGTGLNNALAEGGIVNVNADGITTSNEEDFTIPSGKNVTMNLNGNTLTGNIVNNGTVNVNGGDVKTTDMTQYGFNNFGAVTTLSDVDLDSAGGGIAAVDGSQLTFKSGSVAVNSANTSGRYNFYVVGGSEVTIEGGDFSFSKTLNQKRAYIYTDATSTVYVKGGNFGPASTRSGYTAGILGDGKVIITGGTFGFDPSTWVAEGYQAVKGTDGIWTVSAL